ncbi:MAG: biotin transporter BioY [Actinomycetaceae bacterium]|nr:biotin transporter BioY [Actinomycetaceae bacterium]
MNTTAYAPVLVDAYGLTNSKIKNCALVAAGAAVVGLAAQVSVPLWPVPVTGQTLAVLVVGAMLGARRGAAALGLYVVAGLTGVPWFADFGGGPAYVLHPSFGFVVGFIGAAWVAGWAAERKWDRGALRAFGAFAVASLIPFVVGIPYMWAVLDFAFGKSLSLWGALQAGLIPFIPGGIIKAIIAALILRLAWKLPRMKH